MKPIKIDEWKELTERMVEQREAITYDELLSVVPKPEEDLELLEAVLSHLDDMGVSVLEGDEENKVAEARSDHEAADPEAIPAGNLLDMYLAEMAQEPLLTFEEEVALARQIAEGQQAKQALEQTAETSEAYQRLCALVNVGQVARERLSQANTRLVVSIAKRYRGYGIPFPDLIQDGNVGLMRAVDRFDPGAGYRFSTYATWWIRQAVTRSLANHGRVIRIPVHLGTRMREMSRIAERLEKTLKRQPTPAELGKEMGESSVKVRQMMNWATQPLSLEQPVGVEGDTVLGDLLEDRQLEDPEEVTDSHLLTETLGGLFQSLTTREERVLRLRYGLHDGQDRTLQEVAEMFGLSRERIRQIEREALSKLRLAAHQGQLEQFLASDFSR